MLTRLIAYIAGGLVGTTLIVGAYLAWKSTVEQAALAKAAVAQLEQALEDAERANTILRRSIDIANGIRIELEEEFERIERESRDIEDAISGFDDRPSSDVLRETVRRLSR